jgi:hypothetical protein
MVFISYAHDSEEHKAAVLEFATLLAADGTVRVEIDARQSDERLDWYAWALAHIRKSDFVIVVASPMYRDVANGDAPPGTHRGVQAEAPALREHLYRDRETWTRKIIPVVLPNRSLTELPEFVQPYTASHYLVDPESNAGMPELLRVLTKEQADSRSALRESPAELIWTTSKNPVPVLWRPDLLRSGTAEPPHSTLELHVIPTIMRNRIPVGRLETVGRELAELGRSREYFSPEDLTIDSSAEVAGAIHTGRADWRGLVVHREGQRSAWGPLLRAAFGSVFERDDVANRLATQLDLLLAIELQPPDAVMLTAGLDPVGILRKGPIDPAAPVSLPAGLPRRVRLAADEWVPFGPLRRSTEQAAHELTARLAVAVGFTS